MYVFVSGKKDKWSSASIIIHHHEIVTGEDISDIQNISLSGEIDKDNLKSFEGSVWFGRRYHLENRKKKAVQVWTTNFMYSTLYRKEVEDIALLYQSPAVVDFERILEFQITRRPNFM